MWKPVLLFLHGKREGWVDAQVVCIGRQSEAFRLVCSLTSEDLKCSGAVQCAVSKELLKSMFLQLVT